MKLVDLSGMKVGDWEVLHRVENGAGKKPRWLCRCKCGHEVVLFATHLKRGLVRECPQTPNHTPVKKISSYSSWRSMLSRCYLPAHVHYARYGGRGISVCQRWRDSFIAFYQDMGERPEGMSIERIDNNGDYEPGNCKWATHVEQQNNLRSNRRVRYGDVTLSVSQLAQVLGIPYYAAYYQVKKGCYEA